MDDLKAKDNLDTLLKDGEEMLHHSLPTKICESSNGKKEFGRRGSMLAEGACTGEKLQVEWR